MLFQQHSEPSRLAAQHMNETGAAESQRSKILLAIADSGDSGMTGSELAKKLNMQTGTTSARLRELSSEGTIIKTTKVRQSSEQNAVSSVYVTSSHWSFGLGKAALKQVIDPKIYRKMVDILTSYSHQHWDNGRAAQRVMDELRRK